MAYYKCGSIHPTQNSNVVVDTASGAVANFQTPLAMPLKSLKVDINAKQDLHGQSGPYPAGGGINKWDEQWELGAWSSANGGAVNYTDRIRCKNLIPVLPSTSYCIRFGITASSVVNAYDENGDFIENLTTGTFGTGGRIVTTPENCYFIKFSVGTAYGTTYNNDISVNYPSTDTAYHPYSNICQIEGQSAINVSHRGANLWNGEWENGGINSKTGINENSSIQWRIIGFIPVKPDTEYFICTPTGQDNKSIRPRFYNANKEYIGYTPSGDSSTTNRKFKTPVDCYFMRFTPNTEHVPNYDISINYPSSDTIYHTYNGSTTLINLGGTYYGGHFTQDKDGHRQFEVTHDVTTFGDNTWGSSTWGSGVTYSTTLTTAKSNNITSMLAGLKCETYSEVTPSNMYSSNADAICLNGKVVRVRDSNFATKAEWETAMQNYKIVYPIETPYIIDLPDGEPIITLNGINNIYADTGDTTAEYYTILEGGND